MRLLVTGGAGFIGSNFVRHLLTQKKTEVETLLVLDKLTYAGNLANLNQISNNSNFKFIKGDICDYNLVSDLLSQVDAVVNFAAESHVDRSIENSRDFVLTNILGVQTLLTAITNARNPIRFVQISTDEVYGSISKGSWDESFPLSPNSPYSASKASADMFVRAYFQTHELDVLITRCSNNYGPYQYPEKLIPLFITNIIENKKVPIYGDGLNVRDWLHVDDHCEGIYLVLTKGKSGEIYNIGGGLELTNKEITNEILNSMGKDETYIRYVEDRKGHDRRYSINCDKISRELGYKPRITFEKGLQDTINWYVNNISWWKPLKA